MSGLKQQTIKATLSPPQGGDFVWDGQNEDERPLGKEEMRAAIKNKGGRSKSGNLKQSVSIRLSPEVLAYFKNTGKGWQTRMDEILKNYVATH